MLSISISVNAKTHIFLVMRNMSKTVYFVHLYIWTLLYMILYGEKTYGMHIFLLTVVGSLAVAGVYLWITIGIKKCLDDRKNGRDFLI